MRYRLLFPVVLAVFLFIPVGDALASTCFNISGSSAWCRPGDDMPDVSWSITGGPTSCDLTSTYPTDGSGIADIVNPVGVWSGTTTTASGTKDFGGRIIGNAAGSGTWRFTCSIGSTIQSSATLYVTPATPATITGSCPTPGTSATVSWDAVPGATNYGVRIDNKANGWPGGVGDISIDDKTTTFHTFVPVANDASYDTWVHAWNGNGWSHPISTTFTCVPPAVTYTVTPSAGDHCRITPSIPETVTSGGSSSAYTPSADTDYRVSAFEVRAEGGSWAPMTPGASIGNVTRNFEVRATCEAYPTVTFDPNGGSGAMSKQPIAPGDTEPLFANTFTKDGSTFTGWAETPAGTVAYLDQASYTMGTTDVTLYAQWSATSTYTVNPSAGANCSISPNTPQSVAAGGSSPVFSFTPNANYYVSGVYVKPTATTAWTYAGVPSSLSINNVTQNFDITVRCAPFVAPTAMSGTCPPPGTSATVSWEAVAGATHYLLRIDDLADGWVGSRDIYIDDKTTRSHTFVPATNDASYSAWVHGANSYGFSPAASTTFSCEPTTPPIPMRVITFNANGGTGTMINQYIREGDTAPLFANKFTKAGFTFAGWAETPAGAVAYANQANYTMGTADVTLYAKWTVATYTVTPSVVGSGCSISPNTVEIVNHGASSSSYSATASAGYSVVAFEVRAEGGAWTPMTQGASIGNVTRNFEVRATCGSGTITASDCGIALNQSTCSSTVTWDVPLPTPNPHVYQMDQYIDSNKVAEGIWSGSVVRTVQYGTGVSNRFTVGYWDSNGVFQAMAQDTARGSCVSGTVWNGSVCRSSNSYTITPSAGANCSITPSDPEVVFSGGSSRSYTPSAAPGYYVSAFEVRAAITGAPWLPMPPGSSIGNVTQNFQIRALCVPLVKPAPITGTCPAPGTSATVSWGPVTGATFYALRVDNQTTGGWNNFCNESAGDFCEDIAGTSRVFASTATNTYYSWVHPCNAYGCAYAAPNTAYIMLTCIPSVPVCDFKINGSAGPISLLQGAMRNFSWNVIGATSCTASSSDVWSGSKNPVSGSESIVATTTSNHTLECSSPGGTSSCSVQVNVFCNPSTGSWGACNCGTETKTRTNINAACAPWVETGDCDTAEKNACRRDTYNWKEIAP